MGKHKTINKNYNTANTIKQINIEINKNKNLIAMSKEIMKTYQRGSYEKYIYDKTKRIEYYQSNNDMTNIWKEVKKFGNYKQKTIQ